MFGSKPGAYGAGLQTLIDERHLAGRRRSRRRLSRLGRLRLWRRRRGQGGARPVRSAARRDRRGAAQPGQPRARSARQRRLLPVRGRARASRSAPVAARAARSITTTIRGPTGRASARLREEIAPRRARPRGQPEMDRRRHAPRLQGRRRDRRDGRLPVRLRRDRAGGRRCHFDALYEAYLGDDAVREFMAEHNPAALAETESRFREAVERGLWRPRRNSASASRTVDAGDG